LETTYEAVSTFEILGVQKDKSLDGKACKLASDTLSSSSSSAKDLFHAARISSVLGCSIDAGVYDVGFSSGDLAVAIGICLYDGVLRFVLRGRMLRRGSRQ
jgi:hypothetical protein